MVDRCVGAPALSDLRSGVAGWCCSVARRRRRTSSCSCCGTRSRYCAVPGRG